MSAIRRTKLTFWRCGHCDTETGTLTGPGAPGQGLISELIKCANQVYDSRIWSEMQINVKGEGRKAVLISRTIQVVV